MEQSAIYERINFGQPVKSDANEGLRASSIAAFVCPSDVLDGLSQTLLVGERNSRLGGSIWHGIIHDATAAPARIVGSADHTPNDPVGHFEDFSSYHDAGAQFILSDGSVRMLTQFIDLDVYHALVMRANHEMIPNDSY